MLWFTCFCFQNCGRVIFLTNIMVCQPSRLQHHHYQHFHFHMVTIYFSWEHNKHNTIRLQLFSPTSMFDVNILLHHRLGCWWQNLTEGKVDGVRDLELVHVQPLPPHQQALQEPTRVEVAGPHPDELQRLLLLQERGHGLLQHLIGPVSKSHVHCTDLTSCAKGPQILQYQTKFAQYLKYSANLIHFIVGGRKLKLQNTDPTKGSSWEGLCFNAGLQTLAALLPHLYTHTYIYVISFSSFSL